jgi:hypothetical protein
VRGNSCGGAEEDEKAFAAGTRIRGGDFSKENLQAIFSWKTNGRGVSRLARNPDDEIADALNRSQLDALMVPPRRR